MTMYLLCRAFNSNVQLELSAQCLDVALQRF